MNTESIPTSPDDTSRRSVLILTAAVGGGHEALAEGLTRELSELGNYDIATRDGPREVSRLLAWTLRAGYLFQLNHANWTIRPVFKVKTNRFIAPRLRTIYGLLYGRRLLGKIQTQRPDIIISTYPIMTCVLDSLRHSGRLRIPVVTAIADYGVHDLWVGPSTTLHFVVSDASRRLVQNAGGRAIVVRVPVDDRFSSSPERVIARRQLELPCDKTVVLIAAGAWGVGDLSPAVRAAIEVGAYPVVITGKNELVRTRLLQQFPEPTTARIVGWTDQMPIYLAAANCLVQNGGGMTCHEAGAVGIPVLFFRPLPGHGELNALTMEKAGVTWRLQHERDLAPAIQRVMTGTSPHLVPRTGMPIAGAIDSAVRFDAALPREIPHQQRTYHFAGFATVLLLLFWLMVTPWTAGTVDFLMPPVANASAVNENSVVLAVRSSRLDTLAAIEQIADETKTPIMLFVPPALVSELTPNSYVRYGLSQEPYRELIAHPDNSWRATQTASTQIRDLNDTDLLYVLGSERGRTVVATAMFPGRVRMFTFGNPPDGFLVLDLAQTEPHEAMARVQEMLTKFSEEDLSCVFLPANS